MPELMFKCEECGKDFEPDPDCMLELNYSSEPPPWMTEAEIEEICEAGCAECRGEEGPGLELSDEDREALERGETITAGAICICKECQDRLADETPQH